MFKSKTVIYNNSITRPQVVCATSSSKTFVYENKRVDIICV